MKGMPFGPGHEVLGTFSSFSQFDGLNGGTKAFMIRFQVKCYVLFRDILGFPNRFPGLLQHRGHAPGVTDVVTGVIHEER